MPIDPPSQQSTQDPGWNHDPYGRYQQRYWDGQHWTDRVMTGGAELIDPLGSSTVVPFAIPATATAAAAAATAGIVARPWYQPARYRDRPWLVVAAIGVIVALSIGLIIALT